MEIIDYPNYLIYDDGRVWGMKTKGRAERFMKQSLNEDGYYRLSLTNNNGTKKFRTHRLVAQHYIANTHNFTEVDHIDGEPSNNHFTNLRWCSRSINCMNRKIFKTNKSGFKNISQRKTGSWRVSYIRYKIQTTFKTKKEAICFKYIIQLRIKANHYQ